MGTLFEKLDFGLLEPPQLHVWTLTLNVCVVSSVSLSFFLHPLPGFFRALLLNKSLVHKSSFPGLLLGNSPKTCIFSVLPN